MKMKNISLLFATLFLSAATCVVVNINKENATAVEAVGADSYWSTVDPKANKDTLFTKLSALSRADGPSGDSGYGALWEKYSITDKVPGTNKIWDMYGGFQFTYQSKGTSSNSPEGASYNREHSVPKSWWNTVKDDRYCDVVHLVPTDCTVNSRRSNYAFGEVSSASYQYNFPERKDGYGNVIQTAGCSKLGSGKSINGVSAPGTVFEPDDQYKGDFARIYYYFATRYGPQGKSPTVENGGTMFNNNSSDFYMTAYGKALMNKWHVQDPVSQKELDRNDGIESTQGNRNPYVDHPEWADKIFGSNYEATHGTVNTDPKLTINASSTTVKVGNSITLTANKQNLNDNANVQWYIEDGTENVISLSAFAGDSIIVNGISEGTKTVWAYCGTGLSDSITITVTSSSSTQSSITANVEKTYYVGEKISTSDIAVKNSLGATINNFTFNNDGYQFTYADAPSGGAVGNKLFADAVTSGGETCSLTVKVQRKAREVSSTTGGIDILTANDFVAINTQYKDSKFTKTSGATYIANSAKDASGNIQMRSKSNDSGIVTSTSGGNVCSIKITVGSGSNTINIYGKNSAYSAVTDLYNSTNAGTMIKQITSTSTIALTTTYPYIGIRSNNGAIYVESIEITYSGTGGETETAISLANYMMYEDINGQCSTKFPTAREYFNNLSSYERNLFMTSEDCVIKSARERLNAWAKSRGETIAISGGEYAILPSKNGQISNRNTKKINKSTITIICVIGGIGILLLLTRKGLKK